MATRSKKIRWTYAEFARLPANGNRYEVIADELYVTPAPTPRHQLVLSRLAALLAEFVTEQGFGWALPGPLDVLFAEGDYLEPDIVVIGRAKKDLISDRGIEGAPDLVVEIVSPSTRDRDRGPKRERYAYFGVTEYWVVDPDRGHVEIYRLRERPDRPAAVATDTLEWTPGAHGPTLTLLLPELFRGFR